MRWVELEEGGLLLLLAGSAYSSKLKDFGGVQRDFVLDMRTKRPARYTTLLAVSKLLRRSGLCRLEVEEAAIASELVSLSSRLTL